MRTLVEGDQPLEEIAKLQTILIGSQKPRETTQLDQSLAIGNVKRTEASQPEQTQLPDLSWLVGLRTSG
jgi:hypothetical protein